ncbi:gephyrin-like molybdotransferase Glp [uncultured Cohaesibacter sp.]|uniref:molybdopterin molybdotransferase MoeA n=1 Tax=uncultured Cohaesibacter sp. TaxID=1002546 RepID=UPI0029C685BE|nr:gephyrin-like molybdotransferase Glp [uncultured Cohaesibacter sp.]
MISYHEALEMLLQCDRLPTIRLAIADAPGFVNAQPVMSAETVPPFTNSSMDGFAVRAGDLAGASPATPVTLPVVGSTAAGDRPSTGRDGTWEIMTGAALPHGYDAVVKIEDVERLGDAVRFSGPIAKAENVRAAGQDFAMGSAVLAAGAVIMPEQLMALAAVGQKDVTVYRKPTVTIINTGKELVQDAEVPLKPGQIRDASGPYLMTMLRTLGYAANYGGIIPDDDRLFRSRLEAIVAEGTADVVLSTGAVSAGKYDFIPDVLRALGADIRFHKLTNRPGKPALYARFANGIHYFGLPGNPISTAVGLRFLAVPLCRHLQGLATEKPLVARLEGEMRKVKGLRFFCKARASVLADGSLQVQVFDGQESFRVRPLLQANCWAVFDEAPDVIPAGDMVAIYPLVPDSWKLEVTDQ